MSTLGLRAAEGAQNVPNHAAGYLIANYILAFGLMSTRGAKVRLGIDHNAAPREDLIKYGEAAVQSGKISRSTLNQLKRREAAHANSMEGFSFFVGASAFLPLCFWPLFDIDANDVVLLAVTAGVPSETINGIGLWYTASRVAFGLAYAFIESGPSSYLRSVFWWSGNVSCITALVLASKKL